MSEKDLTYFRNEYKKQDSLIGSGLMHAIQYLLTFLSILKVFRMTPFSQTTVPSWASLFFHTFRGLSTLTLLIADVILSIEMVQNRARSSADVIIYIRL